MSENIKPITIVREEFKNNLLSLCNNTNLPMFCMEDVLNNLIQQVHIAAVQQYEKDKEQYENQVNSHNNN